jgi:hypothetical protein
MQARGFVELVGGTAVPDFSVFLPVRWSARFLWQIAQRDLRSPVHSLRGLKIGSDHSVMRFSRVRD